jgi:hypothetical protein
MLNSRLLSFLGIAVYLDVKRGATRGERDHREADPCRLLAHHADFADFSNPSRPPKIKI